jgi:ribonucleoside-triphosphate reductase
MDFYTLTTTCCQIDIDKLFTGGFSTGHGFLREPNSIQSYSALACIAIQSNQNDQHGGQSIPNFDYALAKGSNPYVSLYKSNLARAGVLCDIRQESARGRAAFGCKAEHGYPPSLSAAKRRLRWARSAFFYCPDDTGR